MKNSLLAISILSFLVAPAALNAATLIDVGSTGLASDADVSVSAGFEGYSLAGAGTLTTFNGAVYDYAFHDTNTDGAAPTYIGSKGLISGLSDVAGTDGKINLWTTGNPSADLPTNGDTGVRWADNATFTVDISGLASGSIYVFSGSWQARSDWLDLSMTGGGQTAVNVTNFATSPVASGVLMNVKRVDFTDAADYDLITFTLQESGAQSGYWGGVVLTNVTLVPEPSALLLSSLGALLLLRRRR